MKHTVKQLSYISGVSIRTLHWYDEIGLLKPSYYGPNNYRYYEEEQLLLLQQILFFRELGFSLNNIQHLLSQENFDKINTLHAHKKILKQDIHRKNQLIQTIQQTILYLQGEKEMTGAQLFYGVDSKKHKEYEDYIVQHFGQPAEKIFAESKKRTAFWGQKEWDKLKSDIDKIHEALIDLIQKNISPQSPEVQHIIKQHYEVQSQLYDITREVYINLADIYSSHTEFKAFYDNQHPQLLSFLKDAMRHYAEKNL